MKNKEEYDKKLVTNTNFYGRNKVKSMESLADKVGLNFPEKGTKRLGNISKLEN